MQKRNDISIVLFSPSAAHLALGIEPSKDPFSASAKTGTPCNTLHHAIFKSTDALEDPPLFRLQYVSSSSINSTAGYVKRGPYS